MARKTLSPQGVPLSPVELVASQKNGTAPHGTRSSGPLGRSVGSSPLNPVHPGYPVGWSTFS